MTFGAIKSNSSLKSFPPQPIISSILQRELSKNINPEEKEKVIRVVSNYFANQEKTKNNIRIESGLLLGALIRNSGEEGINLEELGMVHPQEKVTLPIGAIEALRGNVLTALLNATICKS